MGKNSAGIGASQLVGRVFKLAAAWLLILAASRLAYGQDVPEGIVYQKAPAEINQQALARLKQAFSGTKKERRLNLAQLFQYQPDYKQSGLFIGQFLWERMRDDGGLRVTDFTPVRSIIPIGELKAEGESIALSSEKHFEKFLGAFAAQVHISEDVVFRPLEADEMRIIWSMIGWDITEPIFVVEDREHKLIFDFQSTGRLQWIEDLSEPCVKFKIGKTANETEETSCFCLGAVKHRRANSSCGQKTTSTLTGAGAPKPASLDFAIVLHQPDNVLHKRMGNDASVLADYIKRLEAGLSGALKQMPDLKAKGILITVGVKPQGRSRIWCEAVEGDIPQKTLEELGAVMEKVKPLEVTEGPLSFALQVQLGPDKIDDFPKVPKAWMNLAQKQQRNLAIPDDIFPALWPD